MNIFQGTQVLPFTSKKRQIKKQRKGLTKLISLNSVRPFCWFHTYYLITTRFRINNAKISRVIILLSNRTLSALKCPVYKGFQKIFITQTRKVLFALWCSPVISVLEQFVFELLCMNLLCFHLIVLSFYCQQQKDTSQNLFFILNLIIYIFISLPKNFFLPL